MAERRALEAAAPLPPGGAAWLRAQGQAIIAAAKHGALDAVERQVRLVGETPRVPDAAARNAQVICLARAANHLVFGGRYEVADALMLRVAALAQQKAGKESGELGPVEPQALGLLAPGAGGARLCGGGSRARCLGGLESALQSFEQAGDLPTGARSAPTWATSTASSATSSAPRRRCGRRWWRQTRMGLHDLSAAVEHNLGRVLAFRGDLAEAERLERRAIEAFGRQGDPRLEGAGAHLPGRDRDRGAVNYAAAYCEAEVATANAAVAPSLQVAAFGVGPRARLGGGRRGGARRWRARRRGAGAPGRDRAIEELDGAAGPRRRASAPDRRERPEARRTALAVAHERLLARAARIESPPGGTGSCTTSRSTPASWRWSRSFGGALAGDSAGSARRTTTGSNAIV